MHLLRCVAQAPEMLCPCPVSQRSQTRTKREESSLSLHSRLQGSFRLESQEEWQETANESGVQTKDSSRRRKRKRSVSCRVSIRLGSDVVGIDCLGTKSGNAGKWKTPHHETQAASSGNINAQPGDAGVWVTCARNQENKAIRELTALLDEVSCGTHEPGPACASFRARPLTHVQYVATLYGIGGPEPESEDDAGGDVESAVRRQVDAFKSGAAGDSERPYTVSKMNVACLIFVKMKPPLEPTVMVKRICQDAKLCTDVKAIKCRYVNRFSPNTTIGKAGEGAIVEMAKRTLAPFFDLSGKKAAGVESGPALAEAGGEVRSGTAGETSAEPKSPIPGLEAGVEGEKTRAPENTEAEVQASSPKPCSVR